MEISEHCVQIAALAGLTVIGVVAIVYDGSVGEAMAVAVAGAIGYFARALFPGGATDEKEVQK